MQYLILFLAIALLGVALVVGFRPSPAPARRAENGASMLGLYEPDPVLPPVLLPERPRGADIDGLRLSPALRGYRCEQVDGVLDALAGEIERLQGELDALTAPREPSAAESAELLHAWGPQDAEGAVGAAGLEVVAEELAAEEPSGSVERADSPEVEAPVEPVTESVESVEGPASAAAGASEPPPGDPANAPKRDEEGPFEEQSQTFRSL